MIDKKSLEIKQDEDIIYSSLQEIAAELPEHSPRYVLLSYPLKLVMEILKLRPSSLQLHING